MKTLCFALFGIGSLILGSLLFPPVIFLFRKNRRSGRIMRRIISLAFSGFSLLMQVLGLVRVQWTGKLETAVSGGGKLVIANHPSLLDIVFIMSRLTNADCIVKGALFRFPLVRLVVRKLYISNELEGEEMLKACRDSLSAGNNLVIFPEGTRSRGPALNPVKRGAARIALYAECDTVPIRIESPDAIGLRKGDRFFSFNPEGPIQL